MCKYLCGSKLLCKLLHKASQNFRFLFVCQFMMPLFGAEGDPSAWPGPKAWPAALVLVSFFSVNICFQALLKALDPVVLDNVPPLN